MVGLYWTGYMLISVLEVIVRGLPSLCAMLHRRAAIEIHDTYSMKGVFTDSCGSLYFLQNDIHVDSFGLACMWL